MNVTVIGGGNIGTLMGAEIASLGYDVTIYTKQNPDSWEKSIDVFDAADKLLLTGNLKCVTDSMEEALTLADVIFITVPAQLFEKTCCDMLPFIRANQIIGVVPGSGGAEFAFARLIHKGCTLFGLQRVHSIARLKERGKSVYMLGKKSELLAGVIPSSRSEEISDLVSDMLKIPCVALPNYLAVTLTPSNPILHTTRLYSMFKDYSRGDVYSKNFLFYEEWTDRSSEVLFSCDKEVQNLCRAIPLDLEKVVSLPVYYESDTPKKLTQKIRSIKAFSGLTSPMNEIGDNAWIPDFSSRYFTADFSYGLKIIIDLCELFSVDCPNLKMVWNWYLLKNPLKDSAFFKLSLSKEELLRLYR